MTDAMRRTPQIGALESTLESVANARRYHWWLARTIRPYLRYPTLEIGAGLGTLAAAISHLGMHMLVSEPDQGLAAELQERLSPNPKLTVVPGISLPVDAWPELPLAPSTIVMSNVLEHIEDDNMALASLLERAQTVDRLVLVVPAHEWAFGPLDVELGHHRRYTKRTLARVMADAGWQVEHTRYFNPLGAVAWALSGRIFGRSSISNMQTRVVEALLPVLIAADNALAGKVVGQSVVAFGRRPRSFRSAQQSSD